MSDVAALPDDARKLRALIGTWDVTGTISGADDQLTVKGTWTYREAADGWGVHGVLHTEISGVGTFEESELIGLDAATGTVHLFSLNMFGIRDHVGGWTDAVSLTTRYTASAGSTVTTEDITINFESDREMSGIVVERVDDEVVLTTELTFRMLDDA